MPRRTVRCDARATSWASACAVGCVLAGRGPAPPAPGAAAAVLRSRPCARARSVRRPGERCRVRGRRLPAALRGLRLRDDGNRCRRGRDRLARADPARSAMGARSRATRCSCGRRGRFPPRRRRCTGSPTRTSRRLRVRRDRRRAARAARRGGLRRPQRELRPRDAAARVRRARRSSIGPAAIACTLEAFRLLEPLADNHRLQIDLRPARGGARRRARCDERRAARRRAAPRAPRRGHRTGDGRARSQRLHAPPLPRRHPARIGAADPASVRPGPLGGPRAARRNADREQVAALVVRVTGVTDVDALTRAQVQDVYDALEELIEQQPALAPAASR